MVTRVPPSTHLLVNCVNAADPWCCLSKCCMLPMLRFEGKNRIYLFSVSSERLDAGCSLDPWESGCWRWESLLEAFGG
jgi:hypothetical protein